MIPTIYLVFVDDWELRGDGSGDPYQIQFKPMRELVRIFNRYGIRGSFNAEVMQQLTFRKYQGTYPELRAVANGWDEAVLETLRQGHDIQLHIHPQWRGARYERNGKWVLSADWSILNYEPQAAREMISAGKEYLEGLLRHVDPKYRCVSFRSGSWCIAPSDHILTVLSELGIVFDMSIVGGVRYDNWNINLDYTKCQESFLPFYPEMTDARRIAKEPQPIVCVPTNHFREGTFPILKRDLRRLLGKISRPKRPAGDATEPAAAYTEWIVPLSLPVRFMRKLSSYLNGNVYISDIAQLDYGMLSLMMRSIRSRARKTGLTELPIILENHTKDIRDFSHIERFVADLAGAEDVKCITLTDLARKLVNEEFAIRSARKMDRTPIPRPTAQQV